MVKSSTIIVRDFNINLSVIDTTIKQKINKNMEDMYNTINQFDLTNIYTMLNPTAIYSLLKHTWGIL